jgi:hypothetical protein
MAFVIFLNIPCLVDIVVNIFFLYVPEVEPQYTGPRVDGDTITLDFVKAMLDEFEKQKCIHKRYTLYKGHT